MRMLNEATGEVICQSNATNGSGPRGECSAEHPQSWVLGSATDA